MPSLNPWRPQSSLDSNVIYMFAGDKLPGLKIGAAFFESLRTNLNLSPSDTDASPLPSPALRPTLQTPYRSESSTSSTLPLLHQHNSTTNIENFSFSALSQTRTATRRKYSSSSSTPTSIFTLSPSSSFDSSDGELDQPYRHPLTSPRIELACTPTDRAHAIDLLTSTILEQRRSTTYSLLTHPVNVICLIFATFLLTKACCYRRSWDDAPIVFLAVVMLWLAWGTFFRIIAGCGYAGHARRVRESEWLGSDEVVIVKMRMPNDDAAATPRDICRRWWSPPSVKAAAGTKSRRQSILDIDSLQYDPETITVDLHPDEPEQEPEAIIGVLILRHLPSASSSKLNRKGRHRGGEAWIRGWAVSPTHRNIGIGTALLTAAVRMTAARRGGDGVFFAADHAHSYTSPLLPHFWSMALTRQRDRKAQMRLDDVVGTVEGIGGRAGGGVGSGGPGGNGAGAGGIGIGSRRAGHRRKISGSGSGNGGGNWRSGIGNGQGYGFGYAYAYGYERKVW